MSNKSPKIDANMTLGLNIGVKFNAPIPFGGIWRVPLLIVWLNMLYRN